MGKVIIISDLHLCDKSNVDDVITHEQVSQFLLFLDYLSRREDVSKIIFNGDLFELWQCNLERIFHKYHHFLNEFVYLSERNVDKGIELIYIPGNHDLVPFTVLGYRNKKRELSGFKIGGLKITSQYDRDKNGLIFPYYSDGYIWVEHGHRFDKLNKSSKPIGKIFSELSSIGERMEPNLDDLILKLWDYFLKIKNKVKTPAKQENVQSYTNKAFKFAKKKGINIIVLGHTHKPEISKKNNIIYVNSGCWVKKEPSTFCEYDEKTHEIKLYYWDSKLGKPVEFES